MNDTNSTPRARAKAPASELAERREQGVAAIVKLLAGGEWQAGSAVEFAAEWSITARAASEWAGEASRQLRALERLDAPALRSMLVARLEKHERAAGSGTREAIAAVSKIAELEGLVVDRSQEQTAAYLSALFQALAEQLTPELYGRVLEIAQGVRLEPGKRGVRALKVTVTDE